MAAIYANLPDGIPRNVREFIVPIVGTDTAWTPDTEGLLGSPVFTISGSEFVHIRRQAISTPTLATLWVDTGPIAATITITDPQNSLNTLVRVSGTFEEKMVDKVERLLMDNVGLVSIQMDGQTVTLQALQDQRDFWLRRVNQQNGRRKRISTINLGFSGRICGGRR